MTSRPAELIQQRFDLRKVDPDLDAASVAKMLANAKAEGKQLWCFTTPKSIGIDVIRKYKISTDKLISGQPLFTHEGVDYGGELEQLSHSVKILIPGKDGKKYESGE